MEHIKVTVGRSRSRRRSSVRLGSMRIRRRHAHISQRCARHWYAMMMRSMDRQSRSSRRTIGSMIMILRRSPSDTDKQYKEIKGSFQVENICNTQFGSCNTSFFADMSRYNGVIDDVVRCVTTPPPCPPKARRTPARATRATHTAFARRERARIMRTPARPHTLGRLGRNHTNNERQQPKTNE